MHKKGGGKMRGPRRMPTVQNVFNPDGTVYGIMVKVKRALRAAGADTEYCTKYIQESMCGNYDQLLPTARKYVYIEVK